MIDTDKYEGHTKGDNEVGWRINNNFVSNGKCPNDRYIAYVQDGKVMEFSEADANLIADVPLLLEEVKRLREAFITAVRHVGEHDLSRDDLFSKLDEDLFSLWLFRSE